MLAWMVSYMGGTKRDSRSCPQVETSMAGHHVLPFFCVSSLYVALHISADLHKNYPRAAQKLDHVAGKESRQVATKLGRHRHQALVSHEVRQTRPEKMWLAIQKSKHQLFLQGGFWRIQSLILFGVLVRDSW